MPYRLAMGQRNSFNEAKKFKNPQQNHTNHSTKEFF